MHPHCLDGYVYTSIKRSAKAIKRNELSVIIYSLDDFPKALQWLRRHEYNTRDSCTYANIHSMHYIAIASLVIIIQTAV